MKSGEAWLPVVSFKRVFDKAPLGERLSLGSLVAALRRFEVKAETALAVERELARVARAHDAVLAGAEADGPAAITLRKARAAALAAGGDPDTAVRAAAERLEADARREAKRDLRLWSPAVYRPGAERGSDGVLAVGALVLDFDHDPDPDALVADYDAWFHVLHTTWSHTEARPRLRLVVPLAQVVDAVDQPAAWTWADARAGGGADPAGKGLAATFALPAVPHALAPRRAWVNPGPLLHPEELGLFAGGTSVAHLPPGPLPDSPFRRDDPRHAWTEASGPLGEGPRPA